MNTEICNYLKKMSLGFFSLLLLSCSESVLDDERGGTPEILQVVSSSSVIRADESAENNDIVGVRDELIIANKETINALSPEKAVALSAFVNTISPKVGTKTFVKTTVRKAKVMAVDTGEEKILTGDPLDIHTAIISIIESMTARIKGNTSMRVIIELWFEAVSDNDFYKMYPDYPYTSSVLSGN